MLFLNRLYAPGFATGNCEVIGDPDEADIISAHEWGPCELNERTGSLDPGEVNRRLAQMALELQGRRSRPIATRPAIQIALSQICGREVEVDYLLTGETIDIFGRGAGTAEEVRATKAAMESGGFQRPVFLANARQVGRVANHARREGICDYVVPEGLPSAFRPESSQPWIRRNAFWIPRELIGAPILLAQGKL